MTFKVKFKEDLSIKPSIDTGKNFSTAFSGATGYAIVEHNRLIHRDLDDQHPVNAITGLQAALDSKLSIDEAIVFYCGDAVELIA